MVGAKVAEPRRRVVEKSAAFLFGLIEKGV